MMVDMSRSCGREPTYSRRMGKALVKNPKLRPCSESSRFPLWRVHVDML